MTASTEHPGRTELGTEVRRASGWAIAGGVLLVLAGVVGLVYTAVATFTSVVVFGSILVGSGIVVTIAGIAERKRRPDLGFVILAGPLSLVGGIVVLAHLGASTLSLTLVVATLLIAGGLMRLVAPAALDLRRSGWEVVAAIASIVLGVMALVQWPASSVYLIGALVSAQVVVDGVSLATAGSVGRRVGGGCAVPREPS
jgi:uncharacterized membrane protein HdeD (DUF308 family)